MNQQGLETKYSRRNIRHIVKECVEQELDNVLVSWFFELSLKIVNYLESQPSYESKARRIEILSSEKTLDELAIGIASAVLKSEETQVFQAVVGWLSGEMPDQFDVWDKARTAAELLALGNDLGLYQIQRSTEMGETHKLVPMHSLDPELYVWINQTMYNLPMIEPPNKVTDNNNCGYQSIRESVILGGHLKQHEENQCLDIINILNSTQWQLDLDVYAAGPVLPDGMDAQQSEAFLRAYQVTTTELLNHNNRFWFCWQTDTRGRLYSHGWQVNFQSFEFLKALVSPTFSEVVSDEIL